VFWRETGIKDEDDEVEAREGACSMETAMMRGCWPQCAAKKKKKRVAVVDAARLALLWRVVPFFVCAQSRGRGGEGVVEKGVD